MISVIIDRLTTQWLRAVLSALVLLAFLIHARYEPGDPLRFGFVDRLEYIAYDARLKLTMPETVDPRIIIVDIDEKSLQAEGQWPWGRNRMAQMVEQLFNKYKISVLGFDIVFAEPDRSSGLQTLQQLKATAFQNAPVIIAEIDKLAPQLDYDRQFAETLAKYPVVMGYVFLGASKGAETTRTGELPPPAFAKDVFSNKRIAFETAQGFAANLPAFQQATRVGGHFVPKVDEDGIVRRVPMLFNLEGAQYESLSLAIARLALGVDEIQVRFEKVPAMAAKRYSGLETLLVGSRLVPVDEFVQTLIPYRGPQGSFPYVPATDVINGTADAKVIKPGSIVLVGTSAAGLQDLRATPMSKAYAGVEAHANLVSGILDGNLMQKPAYVKGAEFLLLLIFGLVLVFALPLLESVPATLVVLASLIIFTALNFWVWSSGHLVLPLASGLLMIGLMYVLNMAYGYFIEGRGKRQLTGLFGQYIPPELVAEMASNPDKYSLDAQSREMTVMFSDVRGFTTISETMQPKQLSELMNAILTPMTRVIHDNRGTIDKYMGDAIMAFWGAPLPDRHHARHALDAAMDMQEKLKTINKNFQARGWPTVQIGIGLNTGAMNVGNMGSEFRMAYTVMGDSVNLGSRLEGLTKSYGVYCIVSESTKAAVSEFAYRELDVVRVKGKDKPVAIYEPLGLAASIDKATQDELKVYRQALKYYRAQEWELAELQFLNLAKSASNPYFYKMYAERAGFFRAHPPAKDWDGVYTHTSK